MRLTAAQRDRACGSLLATAAGDALGAGYEFGPPLPNETQVEMTGGGAFGWAPGEWTDDTSMAMAIAEVATSGQDLRSDSAQDALVARWCEWAAHAADVGAQTRAVLSAVAGGRPGSAAVARRAARTLHERTGRTAGNGSLMRTAPVALAYLADERALVEAASAVSGLTHFDPEAGEACVLWCLAIRHAVLTGELDIRRGLDMLTPERRAAWAERISVAEASRPSDFRHNGWVVEAFQGAWSAIAATAVPTEDPARGSFRANHLRLALEAAVRGGRDTDTVAAIAGGLLGAAHGSSAVPAAWRRLLNGWPGMRTHGLVELAGAVTRGGAVDAFDLSYRGYRGVDALARHPYDERLWLGGVGALHTLPPEVDAVVSLCRVAPDDVPRCVEHVEVHLIDRAEPAENPNLGFVLADTVALLSQLRREGRTVLLHCVQAESRTPTVAALYGMRLRGVSADAALADVRHALPACRPNEQFRAALRAADEGENCRTQLES